MFNDFFLKAHQSKLSERNANVHRILCELDMPNFKTKKHKKKSCKLIKINEKKKKMKKKKCVTIKRVDPSVIDQFDHVFLFGDTNYRINAERTFVFDAIKQGDYNVKCILELTYAHIH